MPDALYIRRASQVLEITPDQLLESDPALIAQLLEVVRCDNVLQQMEMDASKLTSADYELLEIMGYNDRVESDEEWLIG